MFAKLDKVLDRYTELEKLTQDPDITQNIALYQKYAKELAQIRSLATRYAHYRKLKEELQSLRSDQLRHKDDAAYSDLITDEIKSIESKINVLDAELEEEIFDSDNSDNRKNIIMEIRAGTGGTEAALFAGELYRMYSKYAVKKGWSVEVLDASYSEKNGVKEIVFSVTGNKVYGLMKFESGTHRVQRVPVTEASGRIHTSAATVAVLAEPEEIDVKLNPQDIKIDVYRASGAGGQHVNKTESAVRLTHIPTGVVVACQDERSQHKNKAKAMRILRTKVYEGMQKMQTDKISEERRLQVGSGDRSEKIRTYNFPDSRVTDHRICFTMHRIAEVMEGDLDEIIDALKNEERKMRRGTPK